MNEALDAPDAIPPMIGRDGSLQCVNAGNKRVIGVENGSAKKKASLVSSCKPIHWGISSGFVIGIGFVGEVVQGVSVTFGRCIAIAERPATPSSSKSQPTTDSVVNPIMTFGDSALRISETASSSVSR